jgi:hypothetical protein
MKLYDIDGVKYCDRKEAEAFLMLGHRGLIWSMFNDVEAGLRKAFADQPEKLKAMLCELEKQRQLADRFACTHPDENSPRQ